MPPRKATAPTKSGPLPPPNESHPSRSQIRAALTQGHPHCSSYHSFITSRYFPTPSTSSSGKKRARVAPTLPELVESPLEARVLHEKLLAWYDGVKELRAMPWRKEKEVDKMSKSELTQRAYEVWVSEIMLQQTQVSTVISYWTRWMERFPTVSALAAADQEEVNEVWKGLGYYSRASRLLSGAKKVVNEFDGEIPETAESLLEVDGIGPYSAGAISSIAFGARSAMVDGNVQRVLSRLTALHANATAKSTTNFVWALADVLVPSQSSSSKKEELDVGGPNKPGAWNQALMELGATVCTPKAPQCGECPLSDECLAFAEVRYAASRLPNPTSTPDIEDLCTLCSPIDDFEPTHSVMTYPMAKERKKAREEEVAVCVLEWESSEGAEKQVLLVKRPEKGLLAGLYEFPAVDILPSDSLSTSSSRRKLVKSLLSGLLEDSVAFISDSTSPLQITSERSLPTVTHIYSHIHATYHPLRIVLRSPSLPLLKPSPSSSKKDAKDGPVQSLAGRGKWVKESEVEEANTGGAVGKVWEERERQRKGLPPSSASEKGKKTAGKAGGGEKKGELSAGQTTLSFAKVPAPKSQSPRKGAPKMETKAMPKGKARRKKDGYETEDSEDDVVVVDKNEESEEEQFVPSASYKKRRIAVASDEEDE